MVEIQYYSPTELAARAQETMIVIDSQKKAQEEIATMISMHLARIGAINAGAGPCSVASNSAFLIGSTGSGKSYIIEHLARACDLAFEQVNCAALTQSGVRGRNVGDCIGAIVCDCPQMFTVGGIINLDEADKCFYVGDPHYDAYSVQQDLLKLFEGGTFKYTSGATSGAVCLDKVLFLLSGACAKVAQALAQQAQRRNSGADQPKRNGSGAFTIGGFGAATVYNEKARSDVDYTAQITVETLVEHGLMLEIASRVNSIIRVPTPTAVDYARMVTAPAKTATLNKFRTLFASRGIELEVTPEAVTKIAAMCVERNVGIRSVQAIFNEYLLGAYHTVDSCMDYTGITLETNDSGNLEARMVPGERVIPDFSFDADKNMDVNLEDTLSSEESINQFCTDICDAALLSRVTEEPVLFYFLQLTSHFLVWDCRKSDHCYLSFCKMADAVGRESGGVSGNSVFDNICEMFLEKLDKQLARAHPDRPEKPKGKASAATPLHVRKQLFQHYYDSFKSVAPADKVCASLLQKALHTAKIRYASQVQDKTAMTI